MITSQIHHIASEHSDEVQFLSPREQSEINRLFEEIKEIILKDNYNRPKIACIHDSPKNKKKALDKILKFSNKDWKGPKLKEDAKEYTQHWMKNYSCHEANKFMKDFQLIKDFAFSKRDGLQMNKDSETSRRYALEKIGNLCGSSKDLQKDFNLFLEMADDQTHQGLRASQTITIARKNIEKKYFSCPKNNIRKNPTLVDNLIHLQGQKNAVRCIDDQHEKLNSSYKKLQNYLWKLGYNSTKYQQRSNQTSEYVNNWLNQNSCEEVDETISVFKSLVELRKKYNMRDANGYAFQVGRHYCGNPNFVEEFDKQAEFAMSKDGLNMRKKQAVKYAEDHIEQKFFSCIPGEREREINKQFSPRYEISNIPIDACINDSQGKRTLTFNDLISFAQNYDQGLQLTKSHAIQYAKEWMKNNTCEQSEQFMDEFKLINNFARQWKSREGLGLSNQQAKQFTLDKLQSFCGSANFVGEYRQHYDHAFKGLALPRGSAKRYAIEETERDHFSCHHNDQHNISLEGESVQQIESENQNCRDDDRFKMYNTFNQIKKFSTQPNGLGMPKKQAIKFTNDWIANNRCEDAPLFMEKSAKLMDLYYSIHDDSQYSRFLNSTDGRNFMAKYLDNFCSESNIHEIKSYYDELYRFARWDLHYYQEKSNEFANAGVMKKYFNCGEVSVDSKEQEQKKETNQLSCVESTPEKAMSLHKELMRTARSHEGFDNGTINDESDYERYISRWTLNNSCEEITKVAKNLKMLSQLYRLNPDFDFHVDIHCEQEDYQCHMEKFDSEIHAERSRKELIKFVSDNVSKVCSEVDLIKVFRDHVEKSELATEELKYQAAFTHVVETQLNCVEDNKVTVASELNKL